MSDRQRYLMAAIFCLGWLIMLVMGLRGQDSSEKIQYISGITWELRAKFWRARTERVAAEGREQTVIAEMQKACGTQPLIQRADGEPDCQAKPEKPTDNK